MRFTARQTTRNMCVIALLIFVILISAFWGIMYYVSAFINGDNAPVDYSLHYPAAESQLTKAEIEGLPMNMGWILPFMKRQRLWNSSSVMSAGIMMITGIFDIETENWLLCFRF